ncbi:hypothetical protein Cgig2_009639 [Carnegiea gigantea]|uniref:DUF7642 domain-containing protein n=1 Tax=Carnegiea gigantea TaxID=171969 RepID=A0A9Q1JTG7_9CARY|nr:hypothetical protein Cgig2_009639 [Carnegiea gigantea]
MRIIDEAVVEIESLEKEFLSPEDRNGDQDDENDVLYTASFEEMEDKLVNYQTVQWVLYSLLFVLAWGIGLLMFLYLPVRSYILRKDIRSRKLYVTPNSIVYKVTRPVPFPCFGVTKKEKYVLLPVVSDVVMEQGYLQSFFSVHSIRIENAGVRRPRNHDLQIVGIANPSAFRKLSPSKSLKHDAIGSSELVLLQKLEEVGTSVRRLEMLIEKQQSEASEPVD